MYNNVAVMGRLTDSADVKKVGDKNRATFTMAVQRNYKTKDENYPTDFIPVECWGKVADFVANHLGKGDLIIASGPLYSHKYEDKQGNKRTWFAVNADEIHLAYRKNSTGQKTDEDNLWEPID